MREKTPTILGSFNKGNNHYPTVMSGLRAANRGAPSAAKNIKGFNEKYHVRENVERGIQRVNQILKIGKPK